MPVGMPRRPPRSIPLAQPIAVVQLPFVVHDALNGSRRCLVPCCALWGHVHSASTSRRPPWWR
eukprot:534698-Pyramimonas_sp.AAC.1